MLKKLLCKIVGHDEVTFQVGLPGEGGGRMDVCLRCGNKSNEETWEKTC